MNACVTPVRFRQNHNLYILSQSVQESKQSVNREAIQFAADDIADLGLGRAHDPRSLGLRQSPGTQGMVDGIGQLRLCVQVVRIGQAESCEDIPIRGNNIFILDQDETLSPTPGSVVP